LIDAAGFDIRIIAAQGSLVHREPMADAASLAEAVARLPDVQRVTLVRTDSAQVLAPGRRGPGVRVSLVGTTGAAAAASVWTMVRGSSLPSAATPGEPTPIVVSPRIASELHLEPGSAVSLRLFMPGTASALPLVPARVVGIGAFAFEAAGDDTVATTVDGLAAARGTPADAAAEMVAGVLAARRRTFPPLRRLRRCGPTCASSR